jgi:hypothetical protein
LTVTRVRENSKKSSADRLVGLLREGTTGLFRLLLGPFLRRKVIVMNMRSRIATVAGAAALSIAVASSAYAVNVQEVVQMITHTDLVMSDGTKMPADIVKMHGKMYVMIPVDDLPDYLHQQVTKVMMH